MNVNSDKPDQQQINLANLVYDPVKKLIYCVESTTSKLVTLNYVIGAPVVPIVAVLPIDTSFGAVFPDPSGRLCAFTSNLGTFHWISLAVARSIQTANSNEGGSYLN